MIKFNFLLLVIILFSVTKGFSQNDRWVYITDNEDMTIYYDTETINYNGDEITLNLKYIISNVSKELTDIDYFINKAIYYCGKDYYKIVRATLYYKNGKVSTIKDTYNEDIIPDSIGEDIYRYFCKK